MRQTRYNKKSHKKTILIIIITLVALIAIGVIFFFPLNNTVRNISGGNDTATDRMIKEELVRRVDTTKNGDPHHDKKVAKAVKSIKGTKISDIMKAANDQDKAAKELHNNTPLSSSASKEVAKKVFNDSRYDKLRQAVSSGNWYSAYNQYKELSNNGSLNELRNSINK